MKTILVTGGAGYIGSHTSKVLSEHGYLPVCYDNLSTGHAEFVKWGPLEIGDIHDRKKMVEVFQKYSPEAVIHFAASAYVGESVQNPLKYYDNNVSGTITLLMSMQDAGVKNIVFSSTCATYGIPNINRITEVQAQQPINPYGESKLMIEKILSDMARLTGISQISLRYFNAAGADFDGAIGEKHFPETHLIPLAINSALGGGELKIFGSSFDTKDGTAIRDYIHVDDLGRAHVKALNYLLDSKEPGVSRFINIGTGQGYSVLDIVNEIIRCGLNVKYKIVEKREGDPPCLIADPSLAEKILNWKATSSSINQIIKSAIDWHLKARV